MKILHINAVYGIGSTGTIAAAMQEYINNNTEHICKTAFCYGGAEKDGYIIGNKPDRLIHGLLSRVTGKQGWFSKRATRKLLNYISEFKPDIIQLGNLHGNYINFPMLLNYISKNDIATVVTLHDCWPFTGKCCHYTTDNCYKWLTGCGNCVRLGKDNKSWLLDKTAVLWKEKNALYRQIPRLAVVGVSDWITGEAKKSPFFSKAKIIKRIYNGINNEVFFYHESDIRKKYQLEGKKIIVAVAYFWQKSKGLDDIIELSAMLGDDYRIVLIGGLDREMPKNVLHIPTTSSQGELADWYCAADVFITMSKEETFGKVSAEALMCGTPVVCYNSTANPELIGEKCGYVCQSDSVKEFKELIEKVINNGKEEYRKSCIEYAEKNFNLEKNFDEYIKLYQELKMVNSK